MSCFEINKPKLTKEQIAKCKRCEWISKKKRWCCRIGFYVVEEGVILRPDKKVKYPSLPKMAGSLTKETVKYVKEGRPKRSEAEITRILFICKRCNDFVNGSGRCRICG